jgi:hypothetical protein
VIERVWVDIGINLLVMNMFVGWVAVRTVLDFMCERAVYGGLYVTSHLAAILSNGVNWSSLLPPPLSVSHLRELPLFLPSPWIPIPLRCRNIPRLELRSMMLRFACSFLQVICVIVDLPPLVLQRVVLSWNQYIGPLATAHDNGEDQLKSSPHPLFQPSLSSSPSPKSSIPFSIVKSPSLSTA